MQHRRHKLAVPHLVAGELVGDDHPWHLPQALAQSAEELLCGHRVSARLDQNVEHVAVLVDRAPQLPLCAVDLDEHLIEVRFVTQPPTTAAQLIRVLDPEPVAPGPIVSSDTSTPRSSISSCTSRKLNKNRWYSHTHWLMISGGNRNPL